MSDTPSPTPSPRPRSWPLYALAGLLMAAVLLVAPRLASGLGDVISPDVGRAEPPAVSALLHLPRRPDTVLNDRRAMSDAEYDGYRKTQRALLRSRLVLNAALKQPKVAALGVIRQQRDPVGWLENNLRAEYEADAPEMLRVAVTEATPEEAAVLVNAIVEAYQREIVDKERMDRNARLVLVSQLKEKYEVSLRTQKEEQRELKEAVDPDQATRAVEQKLLLQDLARAREALLRVRLKKAAAEERLSRASKAGDKAGAAKLEEKKAVLEAKERLLNREVEQTLARSKLRERQEGRLRGFEEDLRPLKDLVRRLTTEEQRLEVELQSPAPGMKVVEEATARK